MTTPERLCERLRDLDIPVCIVEHRPVFTVSEARQHRGDLSGTHTKSLFLRELAARIGAGHLSFGSPERLMRHLGVVPGAVSPFAVINETDRAVRVVPDRGVLEQGPVNLHPLDNARTTAIVAADLLRFLEAEGHPPQLLDLPR